MTDDEDTLRVPVRVLIEDALDAIVSVLDGLPSGASAREVRAKVEGCRHCLQQWDQTVPTGNQDSQLERLRVLVFALHEKAVDASAQGPIGPTGAPGKPGEPIAAR